MFTGCRRLLKLKLLVIPANEPLLPLTKPVRLRLGRSLRPTHSGCYWHCRWLEGSPMPWMHKNIRKRPVCPRFTKVGQPILVLRKDFTTIDTALSNVAGKLRQHASVSPWHAPIVQKNRSVQEPVGEKPCGEV
jgi:hypothetical protein